MKQQIELINRNKFVQDRYIRYVNKRDYLLYHWPLESYLLTDLDKDYGDGVMKDIVICDWCNNNIEELNFVMLEQIKVYHIKCAENHGITSNIVSF